MNNHPSNLDISRLEKVRHSDGKITARCPACAEVGRDRQKNNFALFPTGAFHCQAFPGEREHNARIRALVGVASDWVPDPEKSRRWKQQRAAERDAEHERAKLAATIKAKRHKLISRHEWGSTDVWEDSPQRVDCPLVEYDPRHFLKSLFPDSSLIWTGGLFDSGDRHAHRWRTCEDWQHEAHLENVGPMVAPAIWIPGSTSRTKTNVNTAPYTVLDFDGFDGMQPRTSDDLRWHLRASLAIIRWIREGLAWDLCAILWTGSKSLHAWFRTPPPEVLGTLRMHAQAFGLDAGLIGNPEHPCRLPGQRHEKTGKLSSVLWLQTADAKEGLVDERCEVSHPDPDHPPADDDA